MKNSRRILLFFFMYILCANLISQRVTHISVDKGLNSRQVSNIKQDKKGFIWIGARLGVDRFDGNKIKNYQIDILRSAPIPTRTIKVTLDKDSSLWAYTDRGAIYRYDEQKDVFVCHKDLNLYLRSICVDDKNNIWLGTRNQLMILRDNTVNLIWNFKDEEIKWISKYNEDRLLILTDQKMYIYNTTKGGLMKEILAHTSFGKSVLFESIFLDLPNQRIYIGSINDGLFIYDIATQSIKYIDNTHLLDKLIRSINKVDDNRVILGTEGGAYLFNIETGRIEKTYSQISEKDDRIEGGAVYDIYKDKEDKFWLSTYADGISVLNFSQSGFNVIKRKEYDTNSLKQNTVCSIIEDSNGTLWFATNKGISLYDKKTGKWKHLLDSENVLTLYEDSRGYIWAGTYSSGAFLINKKGVVLRNYTHDPYAENTIGTNFLYTICEDSKGRIWFGGRKGKTSILNPRTNVFQYVDVYQTNYILSKSSETMLISTEIGVFEVGVNTLNVKECIFNNHLKSRYVTDMYLESDSILWIGTYGDGINRCNMQTGNVEAYIQQQRGGAEIIYSFIPTDSNLLWFSSESGIGSLDMQSHHVENYSKADGVSSGHFRQISRFKSDNNMLYFGSYEGVVYFNPKHIQRKQSHAKLVLQDFNLFNKKIKVGDPGSPLVEALDNTSRIKLNYKQHSFSIDFLAVDFAIGSQRHYKWKLEGLDDDWISSTSEHTANYTNISPGEYKFHLMYLDDNNRLLDQRQLQIIISPPFWNTIWARFIALICILVIAYWIYRYANMRIKRRQSEERIKFFIDTAHDIRTPLTLISSPIYELKESIEGNTKNNYLFGLILSNLDKLNKMFSQLLDFQRAYESRDQLVIKQHNINKYLTNKYNYWISIVKDTGKQVSLELPDENIFVWFDEEKMDKILDNLISNAIKYTNHAGRIDIQLLSNTKYWKIIVKDNGIGISKKNIDNLFQRFYRAENATNSQIAGSGLGLLLIKKYVSLHGGRVSVKSVENKGSEFSIQILHGKKYLDSNNILVDENHLSIFDEDNLKQEQEGLVKQKLKLYIVEDNDDLRTFLKLSLSHYYQVYVAKDGEEAWENIYKISPDIIVSDLQMPRMDGFELCKKVKSTFETSHIPIILLTVINEKNHVEKGLEMGVDDYIEKPFDQKHLRAKIDNIIKNRKLLRQKYIGTDENLNQLVENETKHNKLFVQRATEIIELNISNVEFSVSDLAKQIGLSRTLLYSKFNAIMGYTPNDFIKIVRMNKAIQYLKENNLSINEISLIVGFNEPAYFSTCFKKIYGKTPSQFVEENINPPSD